MKPLDRTATERALRARCLGSSALGTLIANPDIIRANAIAEKFAEIASNWISEQGGYDPELVSLDLGPEPEVREMMAEKIALGILSEYPHTTAVYDIATLGHVARQAVRQAISALYPINEKSEEAS